MKLRAFIVLSCAVILTSCGRVPAPTPGWPTSTGGRAACPNQDSHDAARDRMFAQPEAPNAAKAEVFDPAFGRRVVTGYVQGTRIIYEGDIIVAEVGETVPFAMVVKGHRWPNGDVPYLIDASLPSPNRARQAIEHWEANTPIRFPRYDPARHRNFIRIVAGPSSGACSSQVGMRTGEQKVHLADGCQFGQVLHEIGHAVGLWHEQSRTDRDNHVCILWENVDPQFRHNFDQQTSSGTDVGPYDYDSIMHYDAHAFSRNNRPTIHPLRSGVRVGQRTRLSAGDIAAIRRIYSGIAPAERF